MSIFQNHVTAELAAARARHRPIGSLHEGYAVIAEELDELWDECRRKSEVRCVQQVYRELVQIAAMAQRVAEDVVAGQVVGELIEREAPVVL